MGRWPLLDPRDIGGCSRAQTGASPQGRGASAFAHPRRAPGPSGSDGPSLGLRGGSDQQAGAPLLLPLIYECLLFTAVNERGAALAFAELAVRFRQNNNSTQEPVPKRHGRVGVRHSQEGRAADSVGGYLKDVTRETRFGGGLGWDRRGALLEKQGSVAGSRSADGWTGARPPHTGPASGLAGSRGLDRGQCGLISILEGPLTAPSESGGQDRGQLLGGWGRGGLRRAQRKGPGGQYSPHKAASQALCAG